MELDRALARALLRIALGLNMLVHGFVRARALRHFAAGMAHDFSATPLPEFLVRSFAFVLPFAELTIGALLIVGLFQRCVLIAGMVVMMTLIFGTALQQRWDVLTQQMVYVAIYAALLATRSWDRWSLDARRGRPGS